MAEEICDLEAERSILGCILVDPIRSVKQCLVTNLEKEHFFDHLHSKIYAKLIQMYSTGKPIDRITVLEQVEQFLGEQTGSSYLADLIAILPVAAHLTYYIEIVQRKARIREIISVCHETIETAHTSDNHTLDEIVSKARYSINRLSIMQRKRETTEHLIDVIIHDAFVDTPRGLTSRWKGIQKLIGGYLPGKLIIFAGRPSQGKTTLALNEARHMIEQKIPVGIIAIEGSRREVYEKIAADMASVDLFKLRQNLLPADAHNRFKTCLEKLRALPLVVTDGTKTIEQIASWAYDAKTEFNIQALFVDYLQLISSSKTITHMNREREVAGWSEKFKGLATDLNIPTFILSQLSRAREHRDNKEPELHDLRDSGSIEQDADIVALIYRDLQIELDSILWAENTLTTIKIAKNRNGPTGRESKMFEKTMQRFKDDRIEDKQEVPF